MNAVCAAGVTTKQQNRALVIITNPPFEMVGHGLLLVRPTVASFL